MDAALRHPPVITSPGPEYGPDTRRFQGIPGIERSPAGRLWATWYGGGTDEGPDNYVMLVTSADDGATWSDLVLVIDPPGTVRAFDPCLWLDPLRRLWLFWAQAYELWDGRGGVWAIRTDEPDSATPRWSPPRRLCNGVMMNKPTGTASGEWVLPVAVWADKPSAQDPAHIFDLGAESGSNAVITDDFGETFQRVGGVDVQGRSCDEHHILELRDQVYWLLARTTYGIGESFSFDCGRTWTPSLPAWIPHIPTARFLIRELHSGYLLLVKHHPPDGHTRSHLTAFISDRPGRAWGGGLHLDDRPGVSYPDATQGPDGTIYLIYDYDRTGAKQILMATFTRDDVLAGKCVSAEARLRVLVNQATGREALG